MKYTHTITIPYQEVDANRRWRLYSLENALLNVAGDVANRLGFGVEQLQPYGYTWILSRLDVLMNELPTHGDVITFETWIEQNAHMLSTRNYRIYKGQDTTGLLIGQAASVWAVLDLKTRQAVNAFSLPMFDGCVDGERLNMERMPRMLSLNEAENKREYTIVYSDIDYNGHCNSCKYLEHMLNTHYPQFLRQPVPLRLTMQYSREVMEGEQVTILYHEDEIATDNTHPEQTSPAIRWQISKAKGEVSATARLISLKQ